MRWYFDALDPGSGRAFASFRFANLTSTDHLDDAEVTYFLEPPLFDPVQVSRSIAFSATRYRFQGGLFDTEQDELPFDTLDDVVEFVRRSYLRRGGGGGSGDGGGAVPEPDHGPEPPFEPEGEEAGKTGPGRDPLDGLREIIREFEKRGSELLRGSSASVAFVDAAPQGSGAAARQRLARGALTLALEQIRVHQRVADHDLEMMQRSRLSRLFVSIASAGLGEEIYAAGMARPRLAPWLTQRFQSIGLPVGDPRQTAALVLPFLATQGQSSNLWFESLHWDRYPHLPWYLQEWHIGIVDDDPVGLLAELALPDILSPIYNTRPGKTLFADQFLFSFLAAPQLATGRSGLVGDMALEVALFASACLNLPSVRRRVPSMAWGRWNHPDIGNLVDFESEKWLRANLPRKLFSKPAEALLSELV